MVETILLWEVRHECRTRWKRAPLPRQSRSVQVQIGVLLADGRWYVDVIRPGGDECRPVADEQSARRVAEEWIRHYDGEWQQIPCDVNSGWQPGERE